MYGIEDRLAVLESKLPDLNVISSFHVNDSKSGKISLKFDEYSWETRLIWHYLQPYYTKAYYQYYHASVLIKHSPDSKQEIKGLLDSCVDIISNLFSKTSLSLPHYMQQQLDKCRNEIETQSNEQIIET